MSRPPLESTPIGTNAKKRNNSTIGLDSYWNKTTRTHANDTDNRINLVKGKRARNRGPGVRPIIVRLIIEQI